MSDFDLSKDYVSQITTVTVRGTVTASSIVSIIEAEDYGDTLKALWDMSGAEMHNLNANDLKSISVKARPLDELHRICAVAILVKNEADLALTRLFIELAFYSSDRPLPHFVSTERKEALKWLDDMAAS